MPIPKPKVIVVIVKGTQKCLAVEYGDDIMQNGTVVYEVTDVDTGCLSVPDEYVNHEMQDLDGNDIGSASVNSESQITWDD